MNNHEHYLKYRDGYIKRAKEWRKKNPKKCREACKKYRLIHPKEINENNKKWRQKNKEKVKLWKSMSPEKKREYQKRCLDKLRRKVLEILGNKCIHCGESDIRCLQIDHVNGGGCKERKKLFLKHYGTYLRFVLKEIQADSKDYQLLCANCNWKKKYNSGEI